MEQQKFSLKFTDPSLEEAYWYQKNAALVPVLRNGLFQSLIFWTLGAIAFYWFDPASYTPLSLIILIVVMPTFLSMLWIIKGKKHVGLTHTLAVFSNIVAVGLIIYIGYVIPDKVYPVMVGMFFAIFFGLYLYRFSKISTLFLVLAYSVGFGLLLLNHASLKGIDLVIAVVYSINFSIFSIISSHVAEKKDRELFTLQRLVEKERDRSEKLLLNILPSDISLRLKKGDRTIADNYNQATILFADIVGFTALSDQMEPDKLVDLLNHIFSSIDRAVTDRGLEKIKTIGDAYMVAGGLYQDDSGAEDIAYLAFDILDFFNNDPLVDQFGLDIRIGFHTGPVTAGVIGLIKFSFDLWGDTVNVASRMESNSMPGRITVSEETRNLLSTRFSFEARPPIDMKGKGEMKTYFLISPKDHNSPPK